MDLEGVEAFVRVADTGSFTEAGRTLSLPKSTVSRRVSRLEESLGVRLLQRNPRRLALTDAGEAYYAQVGPALASIRKASVQVGEMNEAPTGTVRITAPFTFGVAFLGEIVHRFTERHRDIDVEVSLSDRLVDLIADGFDLAIRGGPLEDSALVARPLGRGKSWLIASPAYLDRVGAPASPEDLESRECVLFRGHEGVSRWALEGPDGATTTVTVSGRVNGDEYGFVSAAVESGAGIGCVPWLLCHGHLADGRLVRVLPEWGLPGGQMHLVYPSAQFLPQRVSLFRDFLLEWVKSSPLTYDGER